MDDRQISETLTYIRNTWGNAASPVKTEDVARMREALKVRQNITAN
ncbi:MAG: cytochrome c, partial [Mesorhizobium sp.]